MTSQHRTGRGFHGWAAALRFLAGVAGLGMAAGGGCAGNAPAPAGAGGSTEASLGEAEQALASAQVCLSIARQGASGTVFDTNLINKSPPSTHGSSQTAALGPVGGVENDILLQFDLSAIPSGANTNIVTASVNLARGPIAPSGPGTIEVHNALAPWSESTATYQSFNNQYTATPVTTFSNGYSPSNLYPSFGITALVQAWVRGTTPNDGLLLRDPGTSTTVFWTSEYANYYARPNLYVCYTVTCNPGFADCNNSGLDGCETNLTSSAANCGACGNACSVPNATAACSNSTCQVGSCNLGFGNCDSSQANGCETLLTTNQNCGGCGVTCSKPNGQASCGAGTCTLTSCNAGFYDCDGNPGNGCEALPCGNGQHCSTSAQCSSGVCSGGFCAAPSCTDGVKNGAETAADCGGGSCPPCASGKTCAASGDCQSNVCQGGVCQSVSCTDGAKNGNETGVDCGGGTCPTCAGGQGCAVGSDCRSGVCTAGVCQAPACNDGLENGAETSVDCGGGTCPPCASGKACLAGADCMDQVCAGGVCQLANCTDGVKNGAETGVDCGGTCSACNPGQPCTAGSDCQSGVCKNGFCQAATCTDGVKNGNETGVDCGGSCTVPETCNGKDDDCNGLVDDGLGSTTCGVGACQVTVQNCVNGVTQVCVPGAPQPEACDGLIDDDCDGVVDNGCACVNGRTQSCYTAAPSTLGVGVCQAGVQTCVAGQWGACQGEVTPSAETCDGLDNDCNGQVDDGLGQTVCGIGACQVTMPNCINGLPQTCTPRGSGVETCNGLDDDCDGVVDDNLPTVTCGVGACQNTVPSCVNGQQNLCVPLAGGAEQCNGLDDDCNGIVDDNDPGGGVACATGGAGACAAGTTHCQNGKLTCAQNALPSTETCNGVDDDCNGQVDEGNPGGGLPCDTGLPGACAAGVTACSAGHVICVQTVFPAAETCNGVDDDCNGQVDDGNPGGGASCSTGLAGVCAAGTTVCQGGALSCAQNVQPSPETCDGLDNDCDGVIDGGNPGGGAACATGLLGACGPGTTVCTGGHVVCHQNQVPTPETCNGLDDDCDGVIDNGNPGGGFACSTGKHGVCAAGVTACNGGGVVCVQSTAPQPESCNGLDDDCDGVIDNGNPGGGVACNTNKLGVCAAGTTVCTPGGLLCQQNVQATAEICEGQLDENCDGQVDEGCACVNGTTRSCYTGAAGTLGVGACQAGTQTCAGGQWGACAGEVVPAAETCNGVDDDCNGQIDEGFGTLTCGVGQCTRTVPACSGGQLQTCVPGAPQAETCNGLDDDCDGVVDNGNPGGNAACSTGKPGICGAGTTACSGGQIVCNQTNQPHAETCNGLDDDCDGVIDNGNPGGNAACSTGKAGICAAGTTVCSGGQISCQQNQQPRAETCNGLDDDCNGTVDDGNPGGGASCNTGHLGVCAAGTTACSGGGIVCNQNVQPGAEVCDGHLDENCDGRVDEGCACTNGATQSCYTGAPATSGVGACHAGTQTCAGGQWGACVGQVLPAAETCDGVDNDCNGQVDDGLGTVSCGVGQCSRTVPACSGGHPATCTPGAPQAETCNGLDDDCDGVVDNGNPGGGVACSTGKLGVCAAGTTSCASGALVCNQTTQPSPETCNGLDDNCDGTVDEGVKSTFYRDADGDGYGNASVTTQACSAPAGYVANSTDCNDGSASVHPGATELCNGVDDNCNGQIDEGATTTFYRDADGDGYGSPTVTTLACAAPAGYVANNTDCNDGNASVHPGAVETCNGIDDNCNGQVDEGVLVTFYRDADGDGYGNAASTTQACSAPAGYVANSTDCNDSSASVHPGASEVCNGVDDNCDGQIDEGVKTTFYRDSDGDGYGTPALTTQACSAPAGYVANSTDCNDANAAVHPGATEVCNGIDDNCDGQIDEGVKTTYYRDADGDGYGNASVTTQACTQPAGYVANSADCNDGNAAIKPGATEVCNGVDDNCNGQIDEGVQTTYYRDADGDGYGNASVTTQACSQPVGYVTNGSDCNDGNAAIKPGATEICDGVDNNCNGQIDEGVQLTFYRDADGDGYGSASVTTLACTAPAGYVSNSTDCNDGNAAVNPGAAEICNGVDDNCNNLIDENNPGGGVACSTGLSGTCATGTTACTSGALTCQSTPGCSVACTVGVNCLPVGYKFSAATSCGSYCYHDEAHDIAINGAGQGSNTSGYNQYALGQLTDGKKGTNAWPDNLGNGNAFEWVGFVNVDPDVTFKFSVSRLFSTVTLGINNWDPGDVTEPTSIQVAFSNDGTTFGTPMTYSQSAGNLPILPTAARQDVTLNIAGQGGAYVKITFVHAPNWTFLDEISFGPSTLPSAVGSSSNPGGSCLDILLQGGSTGSGVYWINPRGTGAFQVYCDMTTAGGGWALLENSVGSSAGTTAAFWNIPYANRFNVIGTSSLTTNWYAGNLYKFATEYRDQIVDLGNKAVDVFRATADGIDTYDMAFVGPTLISGNSTVYNSQFAAGWSSSDFKADTNGSSCATAYSNVTQHYSNCWNYNLGSDADSPVLDGGWGPHLNSSIASTLGLANDGTGYTRVNRISRWARWSELGDQAAPGLGASSSNPGASCRDILVKSASAGDGAYWIQPSGQSAMQVFCDMTKDGGGWALLENSIGSSAGTTTSFWVIPYASRFTSKGTAALGQNVYAPTLYLVGTEYRDEFVDLSNHSAEVWRATATGINQTTMAIQSPSLVSGNTTLFTCQFASGWSSTDFDNDTYSANCATAYSNVTQNYCACWYYNLGSDADSPVLDGGWGPHVLSSSATSLGLATDGSTYTRLNRISRWVRW